MRFYDREAELALLRELTQRSSQAAQFTMLLGRRRIGKTELVRQHLLGIEDSLYFFVERRPSLALLAEFSERLKLSVPYAPTFSDWGDFFVFLCAEAQRRPLVVVFDEFQNFLTIEPAVYSILQRVWDEWHKRSSLHLIAVGSVVGLMKRVFQDDKEPLYGRLTREINLKPLPLKAIFEVSTDLGFQSTEDILTLYGIFGGMPRYYEIIESLGLGGRPIQEVLKQGIFSNFAPFRNEVREIILSEFGGNSHTYIAILEAIATGKTRLSEIAGPVGIPATSLSRYMRELSDVFELVEREVPVTERPWKTKRSRYRIRDPFITFWMRFVYRQLSLYEAGDYRYFLERLDTYLAEYMGFAFERIVKECLQTLNVRRQAPIVFHRIGRWWHRGKEIDLVALNEETGDALFVECKWTSRPAGMAVLQDLQNKAQAVPIEASQRHYLIASKSGFSERLHQQRGKRIHLWDLDTLRDRVTQTPSLS